ncbi:MAG: hypothetical protein NPIRA06_32390 [Nitrospirales bacterium]|nr:MAG: hypothetical protein NPIRA06_32390 [Nitrospirales bacterium]
MNIQVIGKLLFAATIVVMIVGCASSPPRELVQHNDHTRLAAWYQKEARDLRARTEEMRQIKKEYEFLGTPKEGHKSILVQHAKNLEHHYSKAAELAEAMAKAHAEQATNLQER